MIYYKKLPSFFKDFIISDDYAQLVSDRAEHTWDRYPTTSIINEVGIEWFNKNNMNIKDELSIFNATSNLQSVIHRDNSLFAFNFILWGHGAMQWTEDDGEVYLNTKKLNSGAISTYEIKRNYKNVKVVDEWIGTAGDVALVKTDVFHRIVTGNIRRICLSLRTDDRLSFEEIANLL